MGSWSRMAAGLVAVVMAASAVGTIPLAAQSPPGSALPSASPGPTPEYGMRFFGETTTGMTWDSTCGVLGVDPISLHGAGADQSADLVASFDEYDAEAFQWFGHVTGSYTGPYGVTVPVDEPAMVYYDLGGGGWILVASWAAQLGGEGCAMPPRGSPQPAG